MTSKTNTVFRRILSISLLALLGVPSMRAKAEEFRRGDGRRMEDRRREDERRREEERMAAERRYHPAPVYAPAPVVVVEAAPPPPSPGISLVIPISFH